MPLDCATTEMRPAASGGSPQFVQSPTQAPTPNPGAM